MTALDVSQDDFEREFQSRTVAYLPGFRDDGRPVVVVVPEAAHTATGHALAHSMLNLLARAHRRVYVAGDLSRPLECRNIFGFSTLADATLGLARAINPYIEIEPVDRVPSERLVSIGIGGAGADLDLGVDGWIATAGRDAALSDTRDSIFGAGLASCVGSYAAFVAATGVGATPVGRWSAWDFMLTPDTQGPRLTGELDVGHVLCAGAGAVASSLVFFGGFWGFGGRWTFVDGDTVDISNLNRQLAFVAADAGWPGAEASNKADVLADRVGSAASSSPYWFGEDSAVSRARYDVVRGVANEPAVRAQWAYTQPTVLLHATTSPSWQAQVHRHVAGRDDCINCRLPDTSRLTFGCAEGPVPTRSGESRDAALPFLSGTAGLLLLVQLARLAAGRLLDAPPNRVAVQFGQRELFVSAHRQRCSVACRTRLPKPRRQQIDSQSRWHQLDTEWPDETAPQRT
jgi:hypothetical protein